MRFRRLLLLCLAASSAMITHAQVNLQLLSTFVIPGQRLSGCWHYSDISGHEYALVGAEQGIAILDITDPANPNYLFQLPGNTSLWHEVKVSGSYAYAVSEGLDTNGIKNGVQIMDLRYLPDSVPFHFWQGDGNIAGQLTTGHTITADDQYIYVNGHNITSLGRGVLIASLADPWNPTYVGAVTQNYSHDSYVRDQRLYSSEILAGQFAIYDIANPSVPQLLATQATPGAFNHNTWLSDNGQVIFTTDERGGQPLASFDISDLTNIIPLDQYFTTNFSTSEVHNVRVFNDYLINPSYGSQLTIADASRPDNIIEVANYPTGSYLCWDADPYLASGAILATDMNAHTLFLFQPDYQRACYLEGQVIDSVSRLPLPGVSVNIITTTAVKYSNSIGDYRTGLLQPGIYDVIFSKSGYNSKIVPAVSLRSALVTSLNVELVPIGSGVNGIVAETEMDVYPNPASDQLNVNVAGERGGQLWVVDDSGRTVATLNFEKGPGSSFTLDTREFPSGNYTVRMITPTKVIHKRFAIVR